MQSKISCFFKPSSSSQTLTNPSPLTDPIDDIPLFNTTKEPEIRITYTRRTPKTDDLSRSDEKEGEEDTGEKRSGFGSVGGLVKPIGKVLNNKRSYAQFHLDFGQSNFVLHDCSICGLKYARGEEGDEKVHKEFHKKFTHGIPFKGWRNERVIPMNLSEGSRIILVLDSDPPAQKNKLQEVAKMMEEELGSSDGWLLNKLCKVYLFISAQRIAGCLVAEPIVSAYKVLPCSAVQKSSDCAVRKSFSCSNSKADESISNVLQFGTVNFRREVIKRVPSVHKTYLSEDHIGAIICEEVTVPASCGIRAIWVTPSNRRKHVATKLLDAARTSFCTGYVLEQSQLAFSQPTSAGKALASNYCCTESFLVYDIGLNS
ncbi:hypothetical protein IFM89_018892 [Coptis chinensis]|uniref:Uncharacterized protein n=1 Tax=Coptis chinensis TaxID=261450 RepID=A0A835LS30_9MAGN|nr:hypothetical protein IFM89_018892 [Coptis chinensis]